MARTNSVSLSSVWRIAVSIVLGVLIAGCSKEYDRDPSSSAGSAMGSQRDSKAVAGDPSSPSAGVQEGKKLFDSLGCMGCHTVNGQGGSVGPNLSNEGNSGRSRQWLTTQIRDPRENDPQTVMPAFNNLTKQKVNDLVDYLESLKTGPSQSAGTGTSVSQRTGAPRHTPTESAAEEATAGGELWSRVCGECHNLRRPSEYSDAQWAVAVHHMRVRVPLTGQEQKKILDFLQASN